MNAGAELHDSVIAVDGSVIREIAPAARCTQTVRRYAYAVPGFIDIHTHGGGGHDVLDGTLSAFAGLSAYYARSGTTGFLGSVSTTSLANLERICRTAREFMRRQRESGVGGARLLGLHLEGPWLSKDNHGAQSRGLISEPDDETMAFVRKHGDIVRMVTFSYHTEGAKRLLRLLVELNIVPACGHDEAIDSEICEGFRKGIRHVTHLYSNTASFRRVEGMKHLGTLEMALMTAGITVEVIADGRHITKYFWDFIRHNKTPEDIIIVSDSIRHAGISPDRLKTLVSDRMDVIVDRGVAWVPDRSTFAGSVTDMHGCFRRLVVEWNVKTRDAVRMTSFNPARQIGLKPMSGEIREGADADVVFLDEDLHVSTVLVSGVEVA